MEKKINISMPDSVSSVLETLENSPDKFQAFLVGGCVRDALMGATPHDYDIATSASTKQIKSLFPKTVTTGEYFGVTVVVPKDGSDPIEVASFRKEEGTLDGRHPQNVSFNCTIKEDLARRDLTINAMAVDIRGNLVDPFGGEKDLETKVIRTVGNPMKRFEEDYLRILRVFRFSAKLDFTIDPKTLDAAYSLSKNLSKISKERIGDEINKLLETKSPGKTVETMLNSKVFSKIIPKLQEYSEKNPNFSSDLSKALDSVPSFMRLGSIIHLTKGEITPKDLREQLVLTNDETSLAKDVSFVLSELEKDTSDFSIRRIMSKTNKELVEKIAPTLSNELNSKISKIISNGDCTSLKELAVNGQDMINAGLKGKDIGKKLNELFLSVLKNPEENDRKKLLEKINH